MSEQRLQQGLKSRHITMITIGGVIGAGLFVGSGAVINQTGPGALLSYSLAGLLVVLIMRMLGEMAVVNPTSGSFAVYAGEAIGPWAGYAIGWLYWFFWVIVIAIESTAGAATVHQWLPGVPVWILSLLLTLLLTMTNMFSVKSYGEFEYWFSLIKVVTIVAFLLIGAAVIMGLIPWVKAPGFSNLTGRGGFMPKGLGSIMVGIIIVIFSFFGTEVVAIAAGETADPQKVIRTAINSVVWRILLFFIGSIAIIVTILPWDSANLLKSPFVAVLELAGIPAAAQIMKFVVLTSVLSCLNSGLYTSSRMIYGMAQKGDAPKFFLKLNRNGVPKYALLSSTVIAYIAAIFNYISPDRVFMFLVNASGAIALLVYFVIATSHLIKRKQAERANQKLEVKMWFFPYLTYLTILGIMAVLFGMLFVDDMRSQFTMTMLLTALIIGSYFLVNKGKQKKVYQEKVVYRGSGK